MGIISEEVKLPDGTVKKLDMGESLPPTVNMMSRKGLMGSVAAQQVLSAGGKIEEAVEAARKARLGTPEEPEQAAPELSPELEEMIRYVHAIARLHSGRFEDLTPLGMLEVAMLCPYPVCSLEEWREKMNEATGR